MKTMHMGFPGDFSTVQHHLATIQLPRVSPSQVDVVLGAEGGMRAWAARLYVLIFATQWLSWDQRGWKLNQRPRGHPNDASACMWAPCASLAASGMLLSYQLAKIFT